MKIRIFIILALVTALSLQVGCASLMLKNLRSKIPAGHADTLTGDLHIIGGWGGKISGTNINSTGNGHLSADEYSESFDVPWIGHSLKLTGTSIGKKKLQVEPTEESAKPTSETDAVPPVVVP